LLVVGRTMMRLRSAGAMVSPSLVASPAGRPTLSLPGPLPEMPEEQAKAETTHAIAFAAASHTKWFWGGVNG
jgi:hypothetical protein